MTQQQSVPDPELFTKEIEDTIDSLFTPTKEIEIDPVTNEVREVKRKEAAPQPKPEEEATLAIEEGEEEELTLELEEEPEKAEELEGAPEEIPEISLSEEEAPEPTAPEGPVETMEHQFNQLYQSLLTLEWEITKEDDGISALYKNNDNQLLGFVLGDNKVKEANKLAQNLES